MSEFIVRQGDVLLRRVPSIPAGAKEVKRDNGRVILAYGEVTGHAHQVLDPSGTVPSEGDAVLLTINELETYLRLVKPMVIGHEEHAAIATPAGTYQVIRQREYDYGESRRVAD